MQPIIRGIGQFFHEIAACCVSSFQKIGRSKEQEIPVDPRIPLPHDKMVELLEWLPFKDLCRLQRVDKNFQQRVVNLNIPHFQEMRAMLNTIFKQSIPEKQGISDFYAPVYYYYVVTLNKTKANDTDVVTLTLSERRPYDDVEYNELPELTETVMMLKEKHVHKSTGLFETSTIRKPIGVALLTAKVIGAQCEDPSMKKAKKALDLVIKTVNEELPKRSMKVKPS